MPLRFQFSLRALLVVMPVVAAFFGGIHFERERRRRRDEKPATEPEFKLSRQAKGQTLKPKL
ncbi:MAG TPA: hypothetical protein VNH11_13750 [Pirellulales bacterium]|nr:hypothetical protein [Pirellulales bacterium]